MNDDIKRALERLRTSLLIPAAEYVPAIPEAWTQIDEIIENLPSESAQAAALITRLKADGWLVVPPSNLKSEQNRGGGDGR